MFKKILLTFLTLIVPFALASCEPRYFDDVKVAKIKDIYNMNANDPVAASGILFRAASKATWYLTDGTSTIKVYDRDGNIDHDKDLNYDFQKVLIKGKVSEFAGLKQIAMQDIKLNEKSSAKLPGLADISQVKLFANSEKGKEQVSSDFAKLDGKLVKFGAKLLGFKETYVGKVIEQKDGKDQLIAGKTPDYIEVQLEINGEKTNVRFDVREPKWAKWFQKNIAAVKALYKDIEFKATEKKKTINKGKKDEKTIVEKTYLEYKLPEAKQVTVSNVIASVYKPYDKAKKQLVGTSLAQFDISTRFTITFK